MELKEIIKYCKLDNQLAYSSLYDTYYQLVYSVSRRILLNHCDIEDVLIIVFTRIFRNINKVEYSNDQSFIKWMKTITVNESIRFVNSKKQIEFKEDMQEFKDVESILFNDNELDIEAVQNILKQLPNGYRIVFNLFAIEGYNHKEISQMLSISESTSKSQLRKARIRIIEQLKKTGYERE